MSGSLNKVSLVGYLGHNPEIKFTHDGLRIATFSVATTESWIDKQTRTRQDRTEWHRIVIFNERLASMLERSVGKGSRVYIEGQLRTRQWNKSDGSKQYITEIILSQYKGELTVLEYKKDVLGAHLDHDLRHVHPSQEHLERNTFESTAAFAQEAAHTLTQLDNQMNNDDGISQDIPF